MRWTEPISPISPISVDPSEGEGEAGRPGPRGAHPFRLGRSSSISFNPPASDVRPMAEGPTPGTGRALPHRLEGGLVLIGASPERG